MKPSPFLAFLSVVQFLNPATSIRKEPPKALHVVQALQPKGLRISIADEDGMDLAIIHANINTPLDLKSDGQINQNIPKAKDDFWTLDAPEQQLKLNDIVFFWAYVSVGGNGRYVAGHQLISDFVEPSCLPSVTTVNGKPACRGALVLDENFDTFNTSLWQPIVQISDGERVFSTYTSDKENLFTRDGVLHMRPTVIEDEEELRKPLKLEGCTAHGKRCEKTPFAWDILPPAKSVWIRSFPAFAYRFGRLELRLKTVAGDWLRTRVHLINRDGEYGGRGFPSGEMDIFRISGNAAVHSATNTNDYGARKAAVRIMVAACNLVGFYDDDYYLPRGLFSDDFHTFRLTWTPKNIKFEIDGHVVKDFYPPRPGGFPDTDWYRKCDTSWAKGTFMAPFDKEFHLNIYMPVGGHWAFGDGAISAGRKKPYSDKSPRGPLEFWRARDEWKPTWKGDLEIDYIKIWAL